MRTRGNRLRTTFHVASDYRRYRRHRCRRGTAVWRPCSLRASKIRYLDKISAFQSCIVVHARLQSQSISLSIENQPLSRITTVLFTNVWIKEKFVNQLVTLLTDRNNNAEGHLRNYDFKSNNKKSFI